MLTPSPINNRTRFIVSCLLIFVTLHSYSQEQVIQLKKPVELNILLYKNAKGTVAVGYKDIVATLIGLKDDPWYLEADSSKQKRIDNLLNDFIHVIVKNASYQNPSLHVTLIDESEIISSQDSLFVEAFRNTIGATILLTGNTSLKKAGGEAEKYILAKQEGNGLMSFLTMNDRTNILTGYISKMRIEKADSILTAQQVAIVPASTVDEQDSSIFMITEKMPEFPGGTQAFREKLQTYEIPNRLKRNLPPVLYLKILIEKDGSPGEIIILNAKVSPQLQAKIEEAIKAAGKWIPAENNGKFVRARTTAAVNLN